jgi:hypothetical protein
VCNGALTLAEAQQAIVTDWVKVYVSIPKSKKKAAAASR